ncbi:hypothetical protein SEA_ALTADENA_76 [Arthrobacter phage Altadena]|uniref:Uncharacterized protein n=1 Tax=Arthrobacter phage Altadena TaxID=3059064 RepID=A0AA96HTA6_9CAUD|nr:hypothetical protein SEA_ALTADENA_76 [Arthrobacter phage Altadena]
MSETPTTDKYGFPAVPCSRCLGRERMEEYLAVDAGRCFQCHGERVVVLGKAAKAKARFLADRIQLKTVADLVAGDVFSAGGVNTILRWVKLLEAPSEARGGGLLLNTSKGPVVVGHSPETAAAFPVRLYVPTDVKDYLEGL